MNYSEALKAAVFNRKSVPADTVLSLLVPLSWRDVSVEQQLERRSRRACVKTVEIAEVVISENGINKTGTRNGNNKCLPLLN